MHVLHTFSNNSTVPYLSWFAERARRTGGIHYTFLILYPERPAMLDEMRSLGFNCEWIPYNDEHRKWGMIRALPRLWRLMRRYRPDIVHCHLFDDSLPGLIAAWLNGIRVRVITRQDTGFHWLHAPRWVFLDRWNTRLATHVIAISGECKEFLIAKEGAPVNKVSLVHNGIPPEHFTVQVAGTMDEMRHRFGIEQHHLVIGTVARFIEWKGYRHIVGAASRIVERHPVTRFLFCGTGEQEDEIRQLVERAGLGNNVVFTGWVERKAMASFYGLLDIYLHASEMEPFGLVFAEAMMNGVPVVSTPTGAALDAIESGINGILVDDRTDKGLADGVEKLLAMDRQAIGEKGRRTANDLFPFDVMWEGTIGLYERALSREQ